MSLTCEYDQDNDDACQYHTTQQRRARKEHACTYCRRKIRRGENYEYTSAMFDRYPITAKKCADCHHFIAEVGRTIYAECGGWQGVYIGKLDRSWDNVCYDTEGDDPERWAPEIRRLVAMWETTMSANGGRVRLALPGWADLPNTNTEGGKT